MLASKISVVALTICLAFIGFASGGNNNGSTSTSRAKSRDKEKIESQLDALETDGIGSPKDCDSWEELSRALKDLGGDKREMRGRMKQDCELESAFRRAAHENLHEVKRLVAKDNGSLKRVRKIIKEYREFEEALVRDEQIQDDFDEELNVNPGLRDYLSTLQETFAIVNAFQPLYPSTMPVPVGVPPPEVEISHEIVERTMALDEEMRKLIMRENELTEDDLSDLQNMHDELEVIVNQWHGKAGSQAALHGTLNGARAILIKYKDFQFEVEPLEVDPPVAAAVLSPRTQRHIREYEESSKSKSKTKSSFERRDFK